MAEAIISAVLEQLISITAGGIQEGIQEVRLVVGVDEEVKKLRSNLEDIEAVLVDAEERQVKEKTVTLWLDRLKHASYDIEDVLDEWNYAMLKQQIEGVEYAAVPKKKVCFFFPSSCFSFKQVSLRQVVLRHDIAMKIKEVNENLDVIAKQKDRYKFNVSGSAGNSDRVHSTSFVDVSDIDGRVEDKNTLVRKLCDNSEQHLPIISIVGMGGIGKTTLAQFAYNDNEVINSFDCRMWICVSEPFDEYRIAKAVIEALEDSASNLRELNSLLEHINRSIMGKKFLLILDDVWNEDYKKWEPLYHCLKNGLHGSKILITTRKESVTRMMGSSDIINVDELPEEECWLLFRRLAFFGMSQAECKKFEDIGRQILSKCKGLPLAVKTIGSLLRFKKHKEQWENILNSELWKLEKFEEDIFRPLLLSYNDLPSMIKRCFVYCVVFPKDHIIEKDYLIKLWMAQGYLKKEENKVMEIVGEEYFDYLASRSFFQEFEIDDDNNIITCKMHDLVHDFAQFLSKNECMSIEVDGLKDPIINSSYHEQVCHLMVTILRESSFPDPIFSLRRIRSFLYNSEGSSYPLAPNILPKLFGGLTCLKALTIGGLGETVIQDIPKEIGKLIHLRYVNLRALIVRKLPEELCGLYNLQTLDISDCEVLEELPQGIGKLINLRHLENDGVWSLRYMPLGIQRLTNLRTLRFFVVSGGGGTDNKTCSLEGLKYLNLFGVLHIRKLGNVSNVDEARRSELKNQENLLHLSLDFEKDEGERTDEDDEALLEILQPPLDLEELVIIVYRGNTILPNWMMSLTKLRELKLYNCINLKHLPPLGKLPSLEYLEIYQMRSLTRVSNEFLGIESDGTSSSFISFPKLKYLTFRHMYEWEEWDYEITRKGEEEDITIMPSLVELIISICQKLKALPNHIVQSTTLKKVIHGCPLLGYD
ncbi:putative disease resistance protein RGA3 [Pistacia vera]|uniref:putative disease resistance protein RGA3 n=1 Tax=Pistacia vera TaxID=55513 RepID=UPI0012634AFC|nr:putative disease resistance protein RGA3 [Pistacia vera]